MECGSGSNPYPKFKMILCELIWVFFVRRDWLEASLKSSSTPTTISFEETCTLSSPTHLRGNDPFAGESSNTHGPPPGQDRLSCATRCNRRSLLSTRTGQMNQARKIRKEQEGDLVSMMMMAKKVGSGNGGKGDKERKKEDRPRRQKQPNGQSIRRRAPLRRRTVRQRLAEKQVLYPNRSHGYGPQAALDREVRGILTRRPEDEHGTGLSGPELRHLESMLRGDGAWGLTVVVSSMLQTIATIASDVATMLQII